MVVAQMRLLLRMQEELLSQILKIGMSLSTVRLIRITLQLVCRCREVRIQRIAVVAEIVINPLLSTQSDPSAAVILLHHLQSVLKLLFEVSDEVLVQPRVVRPLIVDPRAAHLVAVCLQLRVRADLHIQQFLLALHTVGRRQLQAFVLNGQLRQHVIGKL